LPQQGYEVRKNTQILYEKGNKRIWLRLAFGREGERMIHPIFVANDGDYKLIKEYERSGKYVFATCYDIAWGFILPCKSGVVWEQQTDGVCCHHVYIEGILIPLRDVCEISKNKVDWLVNKISEENYERARSKVLKNIWNRIRVASSIDFEFIPPPKGMPRNQEGFQWVLYRRHEEGHGNSFSIESWKNKPIVLVYPNSD
jgi:hypothetical protein